MATDYASLPAGPDLDRAVAERVMGWTSTDCPSDMVFRDPGHRGVFAWWRFRRNSLDSDAWSPSTDIAAAWEVVEHLRALGWVADIDVGREVARCTFDDTDHDERTGRFATDEDASAPLAICRAALAAIGA